MDLEVDIAPKNRHGLRLSSPVIAASGTFGYGTEYLGIVDIEQLGAIICKGTTLYPREGNPQPRLAETCAGLLNAIGLENIGVESVIHEKAPVWSTWRVPVLVNIAGDTPDEYARLARRLSGVPGVSGLELNISCPNVEAGGAEFGIRPDTAFTVTRAVREVTPLPLIVKLTPNTSDIVAIAEAVQEAGADSVSLINTPKGMAIDIQRRRPALGHVTGGLSGPAIKPIAISMVYEVWKRVKIPIIGGGGIMTGEDALEFIMAGATAVQVGTANLVHPGASLDIIKGIKEFMTREGINSIQELIGSAHQ